jgi:hypothetical protein
MFALQLGVLSTFLSEPVVKALTSGAALHVLVSQLPSLLGLSLPRQIGCFSLFKVGMGEQRKEAVEVPGRGTLKRGGRTEGWRDCVMSTKERGFRTVAAGGRCRGGSPDDSRRESFALVGWVGAEEGRGQSILARALLLTPLPADAGRRAHGAAPE